jgi:ATP-dependent Clp protease ATP-binding subunit ClpC
VFERYTEPARRTLFFARFEASQFGSLSIEPEHLLLGIAREGSALFAKLSPSASTEAIREAVYGQVQMREKTSTSIEIPFSMPTSMALNYGAEEADGLNHKHIGPEHLLLGLLHVDGSIAESILRGQGITLEAVRGAIASDTAAAPPPDVSSTIAQIRQRVLRLADASGEAEKQALAEQIFAALDDIPRPRT